MTQAVLFYNNEGIAIHSIDPVLSQDQVAEKIAIINSNLESLGINFDLMCLNFGNNYNNGKLPNNLPLKALSSNG